MTTERTVLQAPKLNPSTFVTVSDNLALAPMLEISGQMAPFKALADELHAQAERANIKSTESYQSGIEFMAFCKQNADQLEAFRKAVKGPVDDYAKLIQSIFMPVITRLKDASEIAGKKMLAFQRAEEARQKAEQEEARRKAEEEAQKLAEEAEKRGDTQAAAAILDVATTAVVTRPAPKLGMTSSTGMRPVTPKRWTAQPEDPMEMLKAIIAGKLPISLIEWRQVEMNRVAQQVKVVGTHFGLKVYQDENLSVRR